jgi:hypothetical protein
MGSFIKDLIQLINEKEEHKVTDLIIDVTLCFMLDALCLCDDVAIAALWPTLIATYEFWDREFLIEQQPHLDSGCRIPGQ